jgi:hypothetical protein
MHLFLFSGGRICSLIGTAKLNGLDTESYALGGAKLRKLLIDVLTTPLQAIALANGLRRGSSLWTQAGQHAIASLPLSAHAAYRRNQLQAMYVKFETEG